MQSTSSTAKYEYDVYISDVSYFSGKFEAYLRYRQIPYRRIHADAKTFATTIFNQTGMMQVPVVHELHRDIWLRDTTPMIDWFESEYTFDTALSPPDPALHFLHKLLEDFADEWLWQPAMYWRWMFKPSAKLLGRRIAEEVLQTSPLPTGIAARCYSWRQKREWLYADGMTNSNRAHIAKRYSKTLFALENILKTQPYLSGNQPGLADIGFFGPFFRHFGIDPYPAEIMRLEAPHVHEWLAKLWNAQPLCNPPTDNSKVDSPESLQENLSSNSLANSSTVKWSTMTAPEWQPLWNEVTTAYLPYLIANAQAYLHNKKRFTVDIQGHRYPNMKTTPYRVQCLLNLQKQFNALSAAQQSAIAAQISADAFTDKAQQLPSDIDDGFTLPIQAKPAEISNWQRLKLQCFGTPRNQPFK